MTRRPLQTAAGQRRSAQPAELTMLGSEHPFVHASESRRSAVRQSAAVAAVLAGGIATRAANVAWSWALIGAATIVLSTLLIILAGLRQRVRDEAIDLLMTGYQNAPIAAVQNERRRLVSRRTRHALSDTYTTIARQARPAAARAERLITNGTSNLYGSDQRALKAEFTRILDDLEKGVTSKVEAHRIRSLPHNRV